MKLFFYYLFDSIALASPGTGHSHADEDAMASKVIGVIVIVIVSGITFWFLSNKKN